MFLISVKTVLLFGAGDRPPNDVTGQTERESESEREWVVRREGFWEFYFWFGFISERTMSGIIQ